MSAASPDFAVFGSSPLSRLLAGLLASRHDRSVVHIGESPSAYRLARGMDLSMVPITRPDSWMMLRAGLDETLKLLGRIAGRATWTHLDPIVFAEAADATEALAHIRHMAVGFGLAAEAVPASLIGRARQGLRLRDAIGLDRSLLEPALDVWLGGQGVRRGPAEQVAVAEDGSVALVQAGRRTEARQAVLADDEAILRYLPLRQWTPLLVRQAQASILTTPSRALAAPVMLDLDSGLVLHQRAEGGIAAIGQGEMAQVVTRLQTLLGPERQVDLAGQTGYSALATADGAAAFGRAGGTGADVVAGLGMAAAFFAPALARWLCGAAGPAEAAWFGARLVNRDSSMPPVIDYRPGLRIEAA